jgi:uncharacterized protein YdiU (UPF0061 family)
MTDRVLSNVVFEDSFIQSLPGDSSKNPLSRLVPNVCYSLINPTPVASPKIIGWSADLSKKLGIIRTDELKQEAAVLSGNKLLPGMKPYAARYGGHQFGNWAGQLGDGRAITLGEFRDLEGHLFEMQLKGAGPTPYSRRADGRAVLRSSLREFLCSEAMFHLGVPTTRALSLTLTGDKVERDMLYDGNPDDELGAIVCRIAPTFIRFGSFEIFAASDEEQNLRLLLDYVIKTHFSELGPPTPEVYGAWFKEVAVRTAKMINHWMRVGFVHGVMNTDNMSILGLTIDYGPYGWLDDYNPKWTPNTTDRGLRYSYGRQPQIALWNLECLAGALKPLFDSLGIGATLDEGLHAYVEEFQSGYNKMFLQKLGLTPKHVEDDTKLIESVIAVMQNSEIDMTIFFRRLAEIDVKGISALNDDKLESLIAPLKDAYYHEKDFLGPAQNKLVSCLKLYAKHLELHHKELNFSVRKSQMNACNPKYVLRNYMAQEAIDAADAGDYSRIELLLAVLRAPYDEQPEMESLAVKRPDWARHKVGCSALSCSS